MINIFIKILRKPKIIVLYLLSTKISRIIPDIIFLKTKFRLRIGKTLNLSNPKTFNEKLQWLKLYDRNPEYIDLVDKYKVRDYIAKTIGGEYLIPLLGVYNSFEEINFNTLPDQFVLKPTHTSGDIFICRDNSGIDYNDLKKKINKWLKRDYYFLSREWCYKNIKPRIICEKYLKNERKQVPDDYKVLCFNGQPKLIQIHVNRYSKDYSKVIYDLDWNKTTISIGNSDFNLNIPKPKNYKSMLEFSKILAKDIPFARIDFYEEYNKLYFGEITLYPASGFNPLQKNEDNIKLGSWIELPFDK